MPHEIIMLFLSALMGNCSWKKDGQELIAKREASWKSKNGFLSFLGPY